MAHGNVKVCVAVAGKEYRFWQIVVHFLEYQFQVGTSVISFSCVGAVAVKTLTDHKSSRYSRARIISDRRALRAYQRVLALRSNGTKSACPSGAADPCSR